MFVRKIPYQASRRRRIQHWFLLMLRLAALALIILAFARPLLTRPDAPLAIGQGAREVVVLLDTSYSMGYGPRWAAATDAARGVVSRLGASDRASIVAFGSGTEILLRTPPRHSALNSAIASAKPGASATRYCAGAQGGGKPARRVAAAAARSGAHQRLPALRLARAGGHGAAGRRHAHADGDSGDRNAAEPERHRGVAAALALRQPGARHGDRRHHQPVGVGGHRTSRSRSKPAGCRCRARPSAWRAAPARR